MRQRVLVRSACVDVRGTGGCTRGGTGVLRRPEFFEGALRFVTQKAKQCPHLDAFSTYVDFSSRHM